MPEPDRSPPRSPLLRVATPGYSCPSRTDSLILTQSDQRFSSALFLLKFWLPLKVLDRLLAFAFPYIWCMEV